jgi:hypothetical protein
MKNFSRSRWWATGATALILSLVLTLSLVLVLSSNVPTSASGGKIHHYGPFDSTSGDSGTCGPDWANDTFDRFFTVNESSPNVVLENFDDGTFVTLAGPSPNACVILPGPTGNGNTLGAGITGDFSGSFDIAVSGGTFNPKAKCTQSTCNTTAGFIKTVYGSSATYVTGATFFEFNYYTKENGAWHNASANRDGNNGDITGTLDTDPHTKHASSPSVK